MCTKDAGDKALPPRTDRRKNEKEQLWSPRASHIFPPPNLAPNQLSQVQAKPISHQCYVNWPLKVQNSAYHRAGIPYSHWFPLKLHQVSYWALGIKTDRMPAFWDIMGGGGSGERYRVLPHPSPGNQWSPLSKSTKLPEHLKLLSSWEREKKKSKPQNSASRA